MITILLATFLVGLLVLEWRYRLKLLRVCAVVVSMVSLIFAQPGLHRAARVALSTPVLERVNRFGDRGATEYESGILTTERAFMADSDMGANARRISLCVLIWLAVTPILRDRRGGSRSDLA